jgi:hypothetical protein
VITTPTPALVFASLCVLAVCVLVLRGAVGWRWALVVACVRVGISFANFGLVGPVEGGLLDDVTYAREAGRLIASGTGPVEILTEPSATGALYSAAGSRHVGYYFLNVLSQSLFGAHYWSTVLVNVLLSCVAARAVLWLLRGLGDSEARARAGALFFLLHWDVLVWSSFFNLKDTAVLALSAWSLVWLLRCARRPAWTAIGGAVGTLFVLTFFRWYAPILILGGFGLWGLTHLRGWLRAALMVGTAGALASLLDVTEDTSLLQPAGLAGGAVRFLLTPRPWGLAEGSGFLLLPSVLHWLTLPLLAYGVLHLAARSSGRLLLAYLGTVVAFYAQVPEVQGPRHRYQLVFVLAILQFEGLYGLLRQALGRPVRRAVPAAAERTGDACAV